jgi:hypothetical protein
MRTLRPTPVVFASDGFTEYVVSGRKRGFVNPSPSRCLSPYRVFGASWIKRKRRIKRKLGSSLFPARHYVAADVRRRTEQAGPALRFLTSAATAAVKYPGWRMRRMAEWFSRLGKPGRRR